MTDDVLQFFPVILVVRSVDGASLGTVDHLVVELVGGADDQLQSAAVAEHLRHFHLQIGKQLHVTLRQ